MSKISPKPTLVFALALTLASCAAKLDDPDRFRGLEKSTPSPTATAPACPDVVQSVFASASCASASCHAPPASAGGLDLKSAGLAARVVGARARSGGPLADPARPDESTLYRKLLSDSPPARMPMGLPALDDATVACVRAWIAALPPSNDNAPVTTLPASDAGAGGTVVRVASGATDPYTDPAGHVWSADTGFKGGLTSRPMPPANITGTNAPELYRAQRYGQNDGGAPADFAYSFPVTRGRYTVTLKFAENYLDAAGGRRFGVVINDAPVLGDFDVFALVGKNAALDKSFPVDVAQDGPITITFKVGVAQPKVNAIEIVPAP